MNMTGRRAALALSLWLSACASREECPLRIEVARESVEGREEFVYVFVERSRLSAAGVSASEIRAYAREVLDAMGSLIAEAVLEALGSSPPKPAESRRVVPPWVSYVFPYGVPLETLVIEKDGTRKVEKGVIPSGSP